MFSGDCFAEQDGCDCAAEGGSAGPERIWVLLEAMHLQRSD
jgi:hypothetical protein